MIGEAPPPTAPVPTFVLLLAATHHSAPARNIMHTHTHRPADGGGENPQPLISVRSRPNKVGPESTRCGSMSTRPCPESSRLGPSTNKAGASIGQYLPRNAQLLLSIDQVGMESAKMSTKCCLNATKVDPMSAKVGPWEAERALSWNAC